MDKLCKDCRYCRVGFWRWLFMKGYMFARCHHPTSLWPSVTGPNYEAVIGPKGREEPEYLACAVARASKRLCGPEGKYWEKRLGG